MPLHEVFDQVEFISNFLLLSLLVCEVCIRAHLWGCHLKVLGFINLSRAKDHLFKKDSWYSVMRYVHDRQRHISWTIPNDVLLLLALISLKCELWFLRKKRKKSATSHKFTYNELFCFEKKNTTKQKPNK